MNRVFCFVFILYLFCQAGFAFDEDMNTVIIQFPPKNFTYDKWDNEVIIPAETSLKKLPNIKTLHSDFGPFKPANIFLVFNEGTDMTVAATNTEQAIKELETKNALVVQPHCVTKLVTGEATLEIFFFQDPFVGWKQITETVPLLQNQLHSLNGVSRIGIAPGISMIDGKAAAVVQISVKQSCQDQQCKDRLIDQINQIALNNQLKCLLFFTNTLLTNGTDQNRFFLSISTINPAETYESRLRFIEDIRKSLDRFTTVEHVAVNLGMLDATIELYLKPGNNTPIEDIVEHIKTKTENAADRFFINYALPPQGSPGEIFVDITGSDNDVEKLKQLTINTSLLLKKNLDNKEPNIHWADPISILNIKINQEECSRRSISPDEVKTVLYEYLIEKQDENWQLYGLDEFTFIYANQQVIMNDDLCKNLLLDLKSLQVSNANKETVYIDTVTSMHFDLSPGGITKKNGEYLAQISVTCDGMNKQNIEALSSRISKILVDAKLPDDYTFSVYLK